VTIKNYQKLGIMQKKRLETESKRVSKAKNFIEGKFFFVFPTNQLDLPIMGQIMFLVRCTVVKKK
jgi:hypothetical protein